MVVCGSPRLRLVNKAWKYGCETNQLALHPKQTLPRLFEGTLAKGIWVAGEDVVYGRAVNLLERSTKVEIRVASNLDEELWHSAQERADGFIGKAGARNQIEILE